MLQLICYKRDRFTKFVLAIVLSISIQLNTKAQCDCAYPILFVHGWTGDYSSWEPLYSDADFMSAWGGLTDRYDAVLNATTQSNAYGIDGIALNADDDALFQFVNAPNNLLPGCVYAIDFDWFWNQDQNNPLLNLNNPPSDESDSNQSSIEKQGWAVGQAIEAILAANPTKSKVILAGHSMGGLAGREYLQRFENGSYTWWVDPTDPINGHKVAKLITTGTPHRGSNASLGNLGAIFNFDEKSEAVRDLRYSYSTGLFSADDSAPYLFFGPEDDHVDDSYFKSSDIDCDGDYDNNLISSLNIASGNDAWDGTYDNPAMPLPTNVKYSYYTSYSLFDISLFQFNGGDGVVADERQWIYTGGNGSTGNYKNGYSIPAPADNVAYRLSDRVHSSDNVFHTNQTGDVDDLLRIMDEADYPAFAYEIQTGTAYSAFAAIRADIVPAGSEYTGAANNTIDGDWFYFDLTANVPGLDVFVTPHPNHAGRLDIYTSAPADYSNANAPLYSNVWGSGAGDQQLNLNTSCYNPGRYFIRVTHEGLVNSSWRTPYKFRVEEAPCIPPSGLTASVTALSASLDWAPTPCTSQYTVWYRQTGASNWTSVVVTTNNYAVTGLLPGTDYEFKVSSDCDAGNPITSGTLPFSTISCPDILYIPSDPTLTFVPDGVYNVGLEITSDGLVNPNGDVTYYAGNSIELFAGFEVESGGQLLVDIKNCVANVSASNSKTWEKKYDQPTQNIIKESKTKDTPEPTLFIQGIPQPDGSVLVKYQDPRLEIKQINLIALDRSIVKAYDKLSSTNKASGTQEFVIDVASLKPGKYLIEFDIGNNLKRQLKIVKRPEGEEVRSRN